MKRSFFSLIFVLWVLIINAQSKQEKAVAAATEQLRKAMIDADKSALESLVSDKLSYGHSSGAVDDKATFVEKIVSGKSDFVSIDLSEQTTRINGKTAIVRHKLNATTNENGKTGEVHLLVMLVWQKQGAKWILLARQAVKMS